MRAEMRLRTGLTPSLPYSIDQSQSAGQPRLRDGTRASTFRWEKPPNDIAKGAEVDIQKGEEIKENFVIHVLQGYFL